MEMFKDTDIELIVLLALWYGLRLSEVRGLKKEDVLNLEPDEELIYYKDNNIAFTILGIDNKYVLRKKKIFLQVFEKCFANCLLI